MMCNCNAELLLQLTQTKSPGLFPDMLKTLDFFKLRLGFTSMYYGQKILNSLDFSPCSNSHKIFVQEGFDHDEALKSGVIAPGKGVDREYDAIQVEIEEIKEQLNDYLKKQEKRFGCRISYFGTEKKRFQLEIPESNAKRADSSYVLESQKKGAKPIKRYHTDETKEFLRQMLNAEDRRSSVLRDLSRRMFEKFSNNYKLWKRCIELTATLDVLTSLATYGKNQSEACYPEIVGIADKVSFSVTCTCYFYFKLIESSLHSLCLS